MQSLSALKERRTGCSEQLLTITSVIHYRCSQVSKCTNKESVKHFTLSPFISEGTARFVTSSAWDIAASTVLLLAELCKLAVEQQACIYFTVVLNPTAPLPPPKTRKKKKAKQTRKNFGI